MDDPDFENYVISMLKRNMELNREREKQLRELVGDELVDIDKMISNHLFGDHEEEVA